MNLADIHVLPQLPEVATSVLPSKLFGMLASGRPLVATASPDSEIGRLASGCGVFTPPGYATALAEAIEALASDESQRRQLGSNGRERAVQTLHHATILEGFESQLSHRLQKSASA
jgi:colanic acid biosynthesis glycosyl transferase WcaI